ncbi:alpha/beta fold hydrolase [Cupriavidus agavae]|uniref:Alpha/beta hydrolase family protein n=1 Tax=Cupriavidus agavae TaxID=1001822 RepID=A0A4Q7RRZ4_9BURK|nr:alpha/beta fold hydrolase [Cupriavidus agavae]RZT36384.1 alpha/beta hydrolase family protein [Cupriavidus agavae]
MTFTVRPRLAVPLVAAAAAIAAITVMSGCASGPGPTAAPAAQAPAQSWQRVHLGSGAGYDFPVYANHRLDGDLSRIREVVLVQHGLQRNGDDYYAAGAELLKASGRNAAEVLLIAPNFPGTPDGAKHFDNMPVWTVQGWIGGEDAVSGPGKGTSSLQVLDDLLAFVTDPKRVPLVRKVTVAGHSGGAQIVHRYAVLNNVDEKVRGAGIALRYVVANPSSYLYFTPDRPVAPDYRRFAPYSTAACADYDKYRYGMRDMVAYAKGADGMTLYRRYMQRQVTYLAGTEDNDPNHRVLDKACGAQAEGPTRLQRARGYWRYERMLAGAAPTPAHKTFEVVGVGHDQARMFGSQCGAQAVFDLDPAANRSGAACQAPQP